MKVQLQKFDFRSSHYERPDKKWVCGYSAEGKACQRGPDSKGNCCTVTECVPVKKDDRWTCNRSPSRGGPCEIGPDANGNCCKSIPRCQPVRSWRAKRGVVVRWAIGLTLGLLLIAFSIPNRLQVLNPGPLSSAHSILTQCDSCHTSANGGVSQWLTAVFKDFDHSQDSQQCQSCHDLGKDALSPHSLSTDKLAMLSEQIEGGSVGSPRMQLTAALFDADQPLQCNSCHQEHLGENNDIAAMPDGECAVCHSNQFSSFSSGHPEFKNYPNDRRTHLNFDHVSHIEKHFVEDENKALAPKNCLSCHATQTGGGKMVSQSFENTCASCHSKQIDGEGRATAKGLAVLGLPGLDVETLADQRVAIGEWPEYAEDKLTPTMRLLLSTDPQFTEVDSLLSGVDLLDLTEASDEELSAVKNLVWLVKALFYDIEARGAIALAERIASIRSPSTDGRRERGMVAALPPDLIENARKEWFPSLLMEVQRHQSGEEVMSPLSPESSENSTETASAALDSAGEDEFDDLFGEEESEDSSTPSLDAAAEDEFDDLFGDEESADDTTVSNLDAAAEEEFDNLFGEDESTDEPSVSNLDAAGEEEFDSLFGEDESTDESSVSNLDAAGEEEFDSLFGEDEGTDESSISNLDAAGEEEFDNLFGEGADEGSEFTIDEEESAVDGDDENAEEVVQEFEDPRMSTEDRVAFGGWYRDEFQLRYRPTDHADRFIKSWIDASANQGADVLSDVFSSISDSGAPGACMKCHSVDVVGQETKVNWKVRQSDPQQHEFTRFSHEAHFNLLDQQGCQTCHQFDKDSDFAIGFENNDPHTFSSNFLSISQKTCAQCHQPEKAEENCLTCHNYHVGDFKPTALLEGGMTTQ